MKFCIIVSLKLSKNKGESPFCLNIVGKFLSWGNTLSA